MRRLLLVRHALTRPDPTRNPAEWQLDPAGDAELIRLAGLQAFAGAPRVVSSTEPKARLTAEAIRVRHGLAPVEVFDDLCELRKAGWTDRHDEVMAELFAHPERPALPGWESAAAAGARFSSCVERLWAETAGDLVVVAHGTVLSLYLAGLLGQSRVRFADWRSVGFPDLAIVDPGERRVVQAFGTW